MQMITNFQNHTLVIVRNVACCYGKKITRYNIMCIIIYLSIQLAFSCVNMAFSTNDYIIIFEWCGQLGVENKNNPTAIYIIL